MRIVGGKWSGRNLAAPKGMTTRPTADAHREALFNILIQGQGHQPERVLDLFGGTGALTFEAFSHGARSSVVFENDRHALQCIEKNRDLLGIDASALVTCTDAKLENWGRFFRKVSRDCVPFDTIFCDPPYRKKLVARAMNQLEIYAGEGLFVPGSFLIVETSSQEDLPVLKPVWEFLKERSKGDTRLIFYRRSNS